MLTLAQTIPAGPDWVALGTFAGALAGAVVALVQLWRTAHKYPSRSVRDGLSIVDASESLVGMYQESLDALRVEVRAMRVELGEDERRIKALEDQIARWYRGIRLLIRQIRDLGHEPAWEPDNDDG